MLESTSVSGSQLAQNAITAAAGLLGVFVGGFLTGLHQQKERQNARRREQLINFYAPLRGMRADLRAKSELRVKLHAAANAAWQEKLAPIGDPTAKMQVEKEEWPKYEALADYSDEQLRNELVPTYRRMLEHFTNNLGFAEPSTLQHYKSLVEFVEVWNRSLAGSLPGDVVSRIGHSEKTVEPLYEDIESHFNTLVAELRE